MVHAWRRPRHRAKSVAALGEAVKSRHWTGQGFEAKMQAETRRHFYLKG